MGAFAISIVGVGGHGCDRKAREGDKLYSRCGRFNCPDCLAHDFTQRLRQAGMLREDMAYSTPISASALEAIRLDGLLPDSPEFDQHGMCYVEVRDPAHVPTGASFVGVRLHKNATAEAWASFPQKAEFIHWPGQSGTVVDDMLKNERRSGSF